VSLLSFLVVDRGHRRLLQLCSVQLSRLAPSLPPGLVSRHRKI
jgi:hypothetical protein